ncbi:Cell wall-associated hydrolase, NlpC family [Actinobaculum suis]|uniref:C40 family peptidase n=1 Tax=Actinobaculum suis TaxID=1657 RepID=A0A1B9BAD5_9ACTO|nr:C40 family peptidase [Actinobaculum suis]MDY5153643.1 C40 family peptidase [Actinobaculum suis]OCA93058.1 hypothetical protein ACU21_01815 [Actinobaculum suis]OCA93217.1 hypothetical protein ACU20_02325 [Actinobaculum suis]SDE22829.1 Cell wall-associated hydrolase, NlpC family [Actinobaculum suis]
MSGSHAYREAKTGILNSSAGRGVIAALAFGTVTGSLIPAATADTQDAKATPLKAVSNPHANNEAVATEAVTAPADAQWKIEQIEVGDTQAIADAFSVEAAPEVEVAAPAAEAQTTTATATRGTSTQAATAADEEDVTPRAAVSGSGSSVTGTALAYAGSPYRWGGTTPSGWDCIGFVRWVYAQHGVSIGSTPASVLSAGRQVAYSDVQPGDILYWPGHVAISLGNGKNVAAWNPSMGTTVGPDSWVGTPTVIRVF